MRAALRTEWWKTRRSPVPWVATILLVVVMPAMGLGFAVVAERGGAGMLGQKADVLLVGEGWVGYLGAISQIAAAAMFLGVGVVVAWSFGREHVDRTFGALFALPTARDAIAGAKFVVLTGWVVVLSVLLAVVAVGLGVLADVGPFEVAIVGPELARLLVVAFGSCMLALPVAWVASVGRGYLPAVAVLVVAIAASQVAVLFGTGGWFPFAVPGLVAVAGTEGIPTPTVVQLVLVPGTALLGAWATIRWWRGAEVV